MTRTTAFAIILGLFGAPALAADTQGHLVPRASLKDAPTRAVQIRHRDARFGWRHYCDWNDGIEPIICETAAKPPRAPGGSIHPGPGAR